MANQKVGSKITLYGTEVEIQADWKVLLMFPKVIYGEMREGDARSVIARLIEEGTLKSTVLYDGNSVWDKKKILMNLSAIVRSNDMSRMSDYLYKFLSLACGSIAHYNKCGWIEEYPTVYDLKAFFLKNEFGERVLSYQPRWATDRIAIVEECEKILASV